MKDLSIIIASFNTKDLTLAAINSVIKNTKKISFEFVVIDNNSKDGSIEALKKLSGQHKNITVVANKENVGFGAANNQAVKMAKGRFILFLNPDTITNDNVLDEMVGWMDKNPKVGISSCSLKYKDGTIQATGGYFPTLGKVFAWMTFLDDLPGVSSLIKSFHPMHERSPLGANTGFYKKDHQMDWVTGAFFMVRSEVARKVEDFDKDYFMYMEEVDYCFRAKKLGWQVMYLPRWSIIHYGGASAGKEFSLMSEVTGLKVFYKKHMPSWQFPILRLIIKLGALIRIPLFGKTYAKIFVSV
jgi:hypothetical protein